MRAVVQRVLNARVSADDNYSAGIGQGFLILLGIGRDDTPQDAAWLAEKTVNLRVFENSQGKFDLSLLDVKGEALVVSQFTLYGDCLKGRRPDFTAAARPEKAIPLYQEYIEQLRGLGIKTSCGKFGAEMKVELLNDGPVTLIIEKQHA